MTATGPTRILTALWVAEMTSAFETSMILAALKVLVGHFGDPALVGWLITGFLIVGAATAAVVGRLGDLYGRRKVMLVVLAVAAVGSLLSAASGIFALLLAGRLLQGVTASILPLGVGLISESRPPEKVPMAIGFFMSGAAIGTAVGLVLGGLVVDHLGWQSIFALSTVFCLISWLLVRLWVPASKRRQDREKVDWVAGLLFAPGVTLVLLYLNTGMAWGWGSLPALAVLIGGIVLCVAWWRAALRSANPLVDVKPLRDRAVAATCAATAFMAAGAMQISAYFSLLLQAPRWTLAGLGLSATVAGLVKLPSNLTSVLAGPFGGWLTMRSGGRIAMTAGGIVTCLGWFLALIHSGSVGTVIAELIVISFGTTMMLGVAPTILAGRAPPERTSEVNGMLGVIRALFMGIGAQIVATLLAVETVSRGTESYPSAYSFQLALIALVAISIGGIVASLAIPAEGTRSAAKPQTA